MLALRRQNCPHRSSRFLPCLLSNQQQQHFPPVGVMQMLSNTIENNFKIILIICLIADFLSAQIFLKSLVYKSVQILSLFVEQSRPLLNKINKSFSFLFCLEPFNLFFGFNILS